MAIGAISTSSDTAAYSRMVPAWAVSPVTNRRVALVGVALTVSLIAACGGGHKATDATSHPDANASSADSGTGDPHPTDLPAVEDIVEAGGDRLEVAAADWIQVAGGSAWTTLASNELVRLDPASGILTARVPTAAPTCTAMDRGLGALWVGVCSDPASVLRVDPATGKVLARVRLPGQQLVEEGSIAAGAGAVWAVTRGAAKALVKIDPSTNEVSRRFQIPEGVSAIRTGLGGLWLTDPPAGTLIRLDPGTGKTLATVKTGPGARFFAVGERGVWVQNNDAGTVTRVDPATNRVTANIVVDDGAILGGDLAVGGGFVWARVSGSLVAKIDPRTNTVAARYGPPGGSGSVAADNEAVWITAHDVNAVYRLPLG